MLQTPRSLPFDTRFLAPLAARVLALLVAVLLIFRYFRNIVSALLVSILALLLVLLTTWSF